MSLLNELKRRNVFKVTTAYLALGWVVLESSGTVASVLRLPEWTSSFLFWLGLAGLPFVIVFAWVFELTPEGLQRTSEVAPGQSITHATSKRLDYVIIGMLAVAIGLFLLQYFRPPTPETPAATEAATTPATSPAVQVESPVSPQPAAVAPNDKSIAVLPFADMSQAKDQEYFSDGMSEELLNLLAQVPDLKVIARTSSFAFKGKDVPIAEIAKQLNVAHVLEGSVRKAGNTVRITAQLIRTADSTHLWSDAYDRPLDDIFKVQDEIANAIVQALQIRLAGGELSRRRGGTQNLEAYQFYLRGVSGLNESTEASLRAADEYLQKAVRLDPEYGLAWSMLANVIDIATELGYLPATGGFERARELARHALLLSPENAHAHTVLLYVYINLDRDLAAAANEARLALAIDPGNHEALYASARIASALGRWDDAERQYLATLADDPLNPWSSWALGMTYYLAGRFVESESTFRRLLDLDAGLPWARASLAATLLAQGRASEAIILLEQETDEGNRLSYLPALLNDAGREPESEVAMKSLIERYADKDAYSIAMNYAYIGDQDLALQWLERAYQQKESDLSDILGEPLFRNIAHDPRFIAFLKKLKLPTEPVPVNWQ